MLISFSTLTRRLGCVFFVFSSVQVISWVFYCYEASSQIGVGEQGFLDELIYKTCLEIHCSTLTGCTHWWDSGTCLSVIAAVSNMENTLLQCTSGHEEVELVYGRELLISLSMHEDVREISVSAAQSECAWALSSPVLRLAREVLQPSAMDFIFGRGMPSLPKSCWSCVVLCIYPVAWCCALRSVLSGLWPSGAGCSGLNQSHGNCFPFFNSSCRHIYQYFSLFFSPRPSKGRSHALCGIIYGSNVSNSLLISVPLLSRLLSSDPGPRVVAGNLRTTPVPFPGTRGRWESSSNAVLHKVINKLVVKDWHFSIRNSE